jgi:kynurenine formamidase
VVTVDHHHAHPGGVEVPVEYFKELGLRLRNWGRWGEDDQRGTLNLITADRVAAAGRLIRSGKTLALGRVLGGVDRDSAVSRRRQPIHLMSLTPGDVTLPDGATFADDFIIMPLQCGTQWDALAHCSYDDQMYNGYSTDTITAARGAEKLGIDQLANGIVGRGVLLDIAALKGLDQLPPGFIITTADLDAAERRQHVRVGAGDIVLVRTGWMSRQPPAGTSARGAVMSPATPHNLGLAPEPGLSQSCCVWLHERDVAALASDNYAIEVLPAEDRRATLPLHCILIRDMGMPLGELFDLEVLARDCQSDGVWDFFFAAPPLAVANGLGSPVNPVVVK